MKIQSSILRAAMLFQAKNDVRYYLNGLTITNKHVMATNGHIAVMMEHGQKIRSKSIIISFSHKIPSKAVTTKINLLGKNSYAEHIGPLGDVISIGIVEIIHGKSPDIKKVIDGAYAPYDGENEKVAMQAKYLAVIDKAFGGGRDFCHISLKYSESNQPVGVEFHNESIFKSYGNPMVCIMPARI